jgi:hypothetical protein
VEAVLKSLLFRVVIAAVIWFAASAAVFAQCLEARRTVSGKWGGDAPMQQLLCKSPDSATPVIRVEFQRLDSSVASVLLEGRSAPEMADTLGRPMALQNAVFDQYYRLLKTVGREESLANCVEGEGCSISLSLGASDQSAYVQIKKIEGNRISTISDASFRYPGLAVNAAIKSSLKWPQGFQMNYQRGYASNLSMQYLFSSPIRGQGKPFEVALWKYATPSDFAMFNNEVQRYNALIRSKVPREDVTYYAIAENEPVTRRYEALGRLPRDFFVITAFPAYDECGESKDPLCCWNFSYHLRTAKLDVAVIENVSRYPISLDALFGSMTMKSTFRTPSRLVPTAPGRNQVRGFAPLELQPGQRLLVPLRIFFPATQPPMLDLSEGRKIYAKIRAAPAGTVFQMGKGRNGVRKLRKSFKRPSVPRTRAYVYGAALALSGVGVNGRRIEFTKGFPNVLALTAGTEAGSCPYLTSWSPSTRRWTEFGKVLHEAKGKDLEQSQTIRLGGFRSRFRLVEREPEISYIDAARLIVRMKNAGSLALEPDTELLAKTDGRHATFLWGEGIEFSFTLPEGAKESDVVSSELILTGYYERFAAITQKAPEAGASKTVVDSQ